jgi:hypothetical protein
MSKSGIKKKYIKKFCFNLGKVLGYFKVYLK